ncbi:MAG: hypothetical protein WCO63_06975 [Bacteroidota bacterium]
MKNIIKSENKKSNFSEILSGFSDLIPKQKTSQALVYLGISMITGLFGLSREFLNIFGGNEFILGSLLFSWFLLLAAGYWIGSFPFTRFIKNDPMAVGFLFLTLSPVLSLLLLHFGSPLLFQNSHTACFWGISGFSLLVFAPLSGLIGVLFRHFSVSLGESSGKNDLLPALSWVGFGALIGALIYFALGFLPLKNVQIILIISLLNLAFGWTMVYRSKRILLNIIAFLLNVFILILLIAFNFQALLTSQHMTEGTAIIKQQESAFGQLTVGVQNGKTNYYTGTTSYFPTREDQSIEESVHFTLLQLFKPQSVLLISGSDTRYLAEMQKYKLKHIDVLEADPAMIPLIKTHNALNTSGAINYIEEDPATYLLNTTTKYDVIMLLLPDPTTLQLNRYYTLEFFKSLNKRLNENGIVYANLDKNSSQSNEMNSVIFYTMKKTFRHAILIPGAQSHFVASINQLSIKLAGKAMDKGIVTKHLNTNPNDTLLRNRTETTMKGLSTEIKLNRDYHPGAFFSLISLSMPSTDGLSIGLSVVIILLLAFYLFKGKAKRISVFLTGLTVLSMTILLLMSYQAIFGNLYLMMGILISMILAGSGIGIRIQQKMEKEENAPSLPAIQVMIGSYCILILFFLLGIREISTSTILITAVFITLLLAGGILTGLQLTAINATIKEEEGNLINSLYLALMIGMAIGALLGITLLFPIVGLILSCIIFGILNAALGFIFY